MKKLSIQNQYLVFCLLLAISYAYIHYVEFYPSESFQASKLHQNITDVHGKCLFNCSELPEANGCSFCNLSVRGKSYSVRGDEETKKRDSECFMTFWGFTHFAFYTVVGFFCPDLFWQTFTVGVGWELYEYEALDCHDTLDIVFNTAGFFTGKALGNWTR